MFIILDVVLLLIHAALIGACVYALRKISKTSLYSYKTISFLGGIIFLSVSFFHHLLKLITWPSEIPFDVFQFTSLTINSFTYFAMLTAFLAVPFIIFLVISNLILLKKEGKSLPNLLGIIFSTLIVIGIAGVTFSYDVLDKFMNVHSYAGYCFSLWFENLFSIILSYLECLMLATIFVSIKSGRHVPRRDKDYMIILGCRMCDDGKPARLLRGRIDRALEFFKLQKKETKKELKFVPSGGKGADEPLAEATCMKNYLLAKNIDKSKILPETESTTTKENFELSKLKIEKHLAHDEFYKEEVLSLYFDTKNNDLAIKSIDRPNFREKVRVRAYNVPKLSSRIFFEIKSKQNDGKRKIGNKRRLVVPLKDFYRYLNKKADLVEIATRTTKGNVKQIQIARELDYLMKLYELEPKVVISANRVAFVGKDDAEFRLTFDEKLRFRTDPLRLEKGSSGEEYFKTTPTPEKKIIMEVKTMNAMPPWFVAELSRQKIFPVRFSKYGKIYQPQC